jgi:hypothetical protein
MQTEHRPLLTAHTPSVGPAPRPPQPLQAILRHLDEPIQRQLRILAETPAAQAGDPLLGAVGSMREAMAALQHFALLVDGGRAGGATTACASGMRAMFGPNTPGFARARAQGLSAEELDTWCAAACAELDESGRQMLLDYALSCRAWEQVLNGTIGSGRADPDWDMTSARQVRPSAPEARLAARLEQAGLPVQAQVGVSQMGGRRRGGWFRAYWLDCAHRDIAFLLRMDIELDGAHHRTPERQRRDELRNELLKVRGWYVLRFDGRLLRADQELQQAVQTTVKIARRHRRAVLLARTDLSALAAGLHLAEAVDVRQVWEQHWRPMAQTALARQRLQLEQLALLELL